MNKVALLFVLLIIASCQTDKIGFVDNTRLMEDYQERKDIQSKYDLKNTQFNKKRDSISQAFKIEEQALQSKIRSMSKKKANEEISLYQQRTSFTAQQLQQELQGLQLDGQREMDSVISKVKRSIEKFGKDNGYTYILGKGETGAVLYGQDAQDVTDQVLTIINSNYSSN